MRPDIIFAASKNKTQSPEMMTYILEVLHDPNTAFVYGDFLGRLKSWMLLKGDDYQPTPEVVALFISGTPEAEEMIFRAPGTGPSRVGR